jgi:hypothetical protein
MRVVSRVLSATGMDNAPKMAAIAIPQRADLTQERLAVNLHSPVRTIATDKGVVSVVLVFVTQGTLGQIVARHLVLKIVMMRRVWARFCFVSLSAVFNYVF